MGIFLFHRTRNSKTCSINSEIEVPYTTQLLPSVQGHVLVKKQETTWANLPSEFRKFYFGLLLIFKLACTYEKTKGLYMV